MTLHLATEDRKIKFAADPGVREALDRFIAEENARIAPARVTITGIVNAAIVEYIARRDAERASA